MKTIIIFENEIVEKLPDFKLNDYGQDITFYIKNRNNSSVDLTNYTIKLFAKKLDYTSVNKYLIENLCSITDAENGICEYTIQETDLLEEGSFDCYLQLISDTTEIKIPLGYLNVFDE